MTSREITIRRYFDSWIHKDASAVRETFAPHAMYIECWGPAYRGLDHILQWFEDWNKENTVLQWDIHAFVHERQTCVCEWYFQCDCHGEISAFNGVSVIEFDANERIELLKEFQSKYPNDYPYEVCDTSIF